MIVIKSELNVINCIKLIIFVIEHNVWLWVGSEEGYKTNNHEHE